MSINYEGLRGSTWCFVHPLQSWKVQIKGLKVKQLGTRQECCGRGSGEPWCRLEGTGCCGHIWHLCETRTKAPFSSRGPGWIPPCSFRIQVLWPSVFQLSSLGLNTSAVRWRYDVRISLNGWLWDSNDRVYVVAHPSQQRTRGSYYFPELKDQGPKYI